MADRKCYEIGLGDLVFGSLLGYGGYKLYKKHENKKKVDVSRKVKKSRFSYLEVD